MPRRSISKEGAQPIVRRASARIAAVQVKEPTPSPEKPSPKSQKRGASKKVAEEIDIIKNDEPTDEQPSPLPTGVNGTEKSMENLEGSEAPVEKKSKPDDALPDNVEEANADSPPSGFEVVSQSDVPAADSIEVKSAIAPQGEDGELLVGYVQVAKDEVVSHDSDEIKKIIEPMEKACDIKEVPKNEDKEKSVDSTDRLTVLNGTEPVLQLEQISNGDGVKEPVKETSPEVESHDTSGKMDVEKSTNESIIEPPLPFTTTAPSATQ